MADWQTLRIAGLGLVSMALAACAGAPTTDRGASVYEPVGRPPLQGAQLGHGTTVAELALSLIGTPYKYGGSDPSGFDCSGLVYYAYANSGLRVPRTSVEQFRSARKIALSDASAGDLVFFQDEVKLSHVGIYLGDDMFVHAPASGRTVSVASLRNPYYQEHLVAVARLLPN